MFKDYMYQAGGLAFQWSIFRKFQMIFCSAVDLVHGVEAIFQTAVSMASLVLKKRFPYTFNG